MAKKQAVRVCQAELQQAKLLVEMHEIRALIAGTVEAIYKCPGEGVKGLEPIFRIRASPDKKE